MKIEFLTSENVGTCEPRGKLVIGKWPATTYLQSAYRRRYQATRKRTERRGMFHEIAPYLGRMLWKVHLAVTPTREL
jgi:hypothetical protein